MNFILVNNFLQSQISLAAKVLFYFTVLKVIASNFPTSAFALLGAASNLYQIMLIICTMGASSLIVKLFSNSKNNKRSLEVVAIIFLFSLTLFAVLSLCLLVMKYFLATSFILNTNTMACVLLLSFAGIIYIFTQAIMNGKSKTLLLNINNLVASILTSLILFSNLSLKIEWIIGISAAGYSFIAMFLNLYALRRDLFLPKKIVRKTTLIYTYSRLLPFIKMGIVAALAYPITLMCIRKILLFGNDIEQVGLVDAALQLSIGYSMAIYLYCTQFVFKQATRVNPSDFRSFILRHTYFISLVGFIYLILLYFAMEDIIKLLFSENMHELMSFILPFMLADLVKFIYWPNNFYVLAREYTWLFNRAELSFAVALLTSVIMHKYLFAASIETIGYCFLIANIIKGCILYGKFYDTST